jgi:hypothetical protein
MSREREGERETERQGETEKEGGRVVLTSLGRQYPFERKTAE